jgi:hypothetical protein
LQFSGNSFQFAIPSGNCAIAVDVSPRAAHPEAMRLPIRLCCTLPARRDRQPKIRGRLPPDGIQVMANSRRFRTFQAYPKDLWALPGHAEPAVSWHSGFPRGAHARQSSSRGVRHPGGHAHVFVPTRCMRRPTRCLVGFSVATAKTVLVRYISPM